MSDPVVEDEKIEVKFPKYNHLKVISMVNGITRKGNFTKGGDVKFLSMPLANNSDVFVYEEDSVPENWQAGKIISSKIDEKTCTISYKVKVGDAEREAQYYEVAPAKIADLDEAAWSELKPDSRIYVEHGGQAVLHLQPQLQLEDGLYGYTGVYPVVRHTKSLGDEVKHPWFTFFFVYPTVEILDDEGNLKEVNDPHPFINALYYTPDWVGQGEQRVEGRDPVRGPLQFAAGSYSRFLEQQSHLVEYIPMYEDLSSPLFAIRKDKKKVTVTVDGVAQEQEVEVINYGRAKANAYNIIKNRWFVQFFSDKEWKVPDGNEVEMEVSKDGVTFAPAVWRKPDGSVVPVLPKKYSESRDDYEVQMLSLLQGVELQIERVPKAELESCIPDEKIEREYSRLSHNLGCTIA